MNKNKPDDTFLDEKSRSIKMASTLGENATEEDVENVENNLEKMKKGPVSVIWDKVIDIWEAFKSPETPVSLKALLIGSLLYLILPFDVVPDILPGLGLIDDVGVLTLMWTKLNKIIKIANLVDPENTINIKNSISDKVQNQIKQVYEKAFKIAQDKLDSIIKEKARITIYNNFVTLAIFLASYILIINESETSILLGALGLLYLIIRAIFNFTKNFPSIYKFIKYFIKTRNVDTVISMYLKEKYSFIEPLENLKNKIKILDDVPNLEIIVKMQRKALKKTIISVSLTILLVIIMFFILRHYLILKTDYTTLTLIMLPLNKLYSAIIG